VIQTRIEFQKRPLHGGQVLVYQVPIPEPLRFLEPARDRDAAHACARRIRADACQALRRHRPLRPHRHLLCLSVKVNARYVMDPSPTPKFDNPKMDNCPALQLFGAGREKRIYAIPPYTSVVSLDFEDHPFTALHRFDAPCALVRPPMSPISTKSSPTTTADGCSSAPTPTTARPGKPRGIAASESAAPHKERPHG